MPSRTARAGELVLDGFGGSGSTLIAAEKTGRTARLIEYDPCYCDTILQRYRSYTGKQPVLVMDETEAAAPGTTGRSPVSPQPTFEEVAEQRCVLLPDRTPESALRSGSPSRRSATKRGGRS